MIEIGRVCVKIAGRDAGKKGVIIDILDDKFILIDGETRRRKVNILHIEPLTQIVKIGKNASHDEVAKALDEMGLKARNTKPKPKTARPRTKRKTPEQLRVRKEEKRKLSDIFRPKKKEGEPATEATLEGKTGLPEKKKEEKAEKPMKEAKPKKVEIPKKTTPEKKE